MRSAERQIHVSVAEVRQPNARPQTRRVAVGFVDRLVDDVPGFDFAAIAPDHFLDVLGHRSLGVGCALDVFGPIRHRAVPDQRVADHGHVVRLGKGEHGVGVIEAELRRGRPQPAPEQAGLRRQLLTIGLQRIAVVDLALQRLEADAGAVRDALQRERALQAGCRRAWCYGGAGQACGRERERLSARQHRCGPNPVRRWRMPRSLPRMYGARPRATRIAAANCRINLNREPDNLYRTKEPCRAVKSWTRDRPPSSSSYLILQMRGMKYRSDIDGLRAVAILPVVAYHAGLALVPA